MNLYLDTEFNGFGGELISMALVGDVGFEWYQVLYLPDEVDPWVAENVVPILNKGHVAKDFFNLSLFEFLRDFDNPTIYADWLY